jgi:hypothetical protein
MTYPGGKAGAGVYQTLINLMPPHRCYVEPFVGGGAILRMKRPADMNIVCDLDAAVLPPLRTAIAGPAGVTWPAGTSFASFSFRVGTISYDCLHQDGIDFLLTEATTFGSDTLIYCDPPYLMSTRSGRRLFKHELEDDAHRRLLGAIQSLKCRVMISGYSSSLYAKELKGWHASSFATTTRGGKHVAEWVWCNFQRPVALHDYRFLGDNYRERERIKRKQKRWKDRLVKMPILERQALLAAIAATADG